MLEIARGGILRRGLAVDRADVAIVTNISPDHFGEYGIDDLDGLADIKLSIAHLLDAQGLLVLNADDALLCCEEPVVRSDDWAGNRRSAGSRATIRTHCSCSIARCRGPPAAW